MQYLILGATGYLGSRLYYRLRKDGYRVIGTRCKKNDNDELFFYNIQTSNIESLFALTNEQKKKVAIVCIAESKIDKCCEEYELAYDINVVKTKYLIRVLADEGFHVIFFSSDNVYDGLNGGYTEDSKINPVNNYGLMKAEMEQYILNNIANACIFRISKVISELRDRQNIFTEWLSQIESGSIKCIKGNRMSFVCEEDIYRACLIASEQNMQGLYNIVGDNSYTRAELARKFCNQLGRFNVKIQECDLSEFAFKDARPLDVSMSNLKFKNETGYQFMDTEKVMQRFIENNG